MIGSSALFRPALPRHVTCNDVPVALHTHQPEVFRAGDRLPVRRDPVAEKIAWVMDGLIPIGRWSIGLDGILGLVPGLGDIAGALIGMLIVLRAVQAGVPHIVIARMMTNIAIDTFVGSIPFLGDAFDFMYKSNAKNLRIYEAALNDRGSRAAAARHWGFFIALFAGIAIFLVVIAMGTIALYRTLFH
jgi:hypothetical protein